MRLPMLRSRSGARAAAKHLCAAKKRTITNESKLAKSRRRRACHRRRTIAGDFCHPGNWCAEHHCHPWPANPSPATETPGSWGIRLPLGVARAMSPAQEADAAIEPQSGSMLSLPRHPCPRQTRARRRQAKVANAEQAALLAAGRSATRLRGNIRLRMRNPLGVARARKPAQEADSA